MAGGGRAGVEDAAAEDAGERELMASAGPVAFAGSSVGAAMIFLKIEKLSADFALLG